MKKQWFSFLFVIIVGVLLVKPVYAGSILNKGYLDVDGAQFEMEYLLNNDIIYVPLSEITNRLRIKTGWNGKTSTIALTYSDKSKVDINIKTKKFYKDGLWHKLNLAVFQGRTYIAQSELKSLIERETHWDARNKTLFIYLYSYHQQGISLKESLPYQGFTLDENTIQFTDENLPKASWSMDGELQDFRLIGKTTQGNMVEFRYAAFYEKDRYVSQLLLTQRKLSNGDQMIFIKAFSPKGNQHIEVSTKNNGQVYGSHAYHYIDYDQYHALVSEEKFESKDSFTIKAGESLDQWYIFSKENLEIKDTFIKKAWEASESYHKSNTWVTDEGTHRKTPDAYLDNAKVSNYYNINLQASVPMLLMETLQVKENRLLEDFIHNAKYTLVDKLGKDGYWRTGVNTAYLNRAYGLGPNYIDTRMSVDASLFLVRYGMKYDDQEALNKGKLFKNYFDQMKKKGITYRLNGGVFYPDYYSEQQKAKTLVSLNHAIYEANYLYTLYNWLGDKEAKALADEILTFIRNSKSKWITPAGDLYYALAPNGKYYGEDYLNITYVDLFTLQSILQYMKVDTPEISSLLDLKGRYLDKVGSTETESQLDVNQIYNNLNGLYPRKGNLFFSYPLETKAKEGHTFAYISYGTFHWIQGVEEITYKGKTMGLDPGKKYTILITKDGLHIL